ncbi:MAG: cyclic nucleotide-binding domain-containing protein [Anaerolineae bacterium]|nr:cyclic nucleotide-binding domain-containing protein [Anaerolineae bacterium]
MSAALRRLFNLQPAEIPRVSLLSVMAIVFIVGLTWAQISVTAAFLDEVGAQFVPLLFIGDALIIVGSFAVYAFFADRVRNDLILIGWTGAGAVGAVVGILLIDLTAAGVAYTFLYLLIRSISEVISTHWGTYVSDFYDSRAGKRIFPLLSVAVRVAVILSAVSLLLLPDNFSTEVMLLLFAASLVVMGGLAVLMPRLVRDRGLTANQVEALQTETTGDEHPPAYWANLRDGFRFVLGSPYLRALAVMSILMMVATSNLNFRAFDIFEVTLQNDQAISNYIALITLIGGLVILPMQLFFFGRLVTRIGVGNTNLIFPATVVIVAGLLAVFPEALGIGALAYFATTSINVAVRATNDELLYNAVPLRVKARTRAFISGVVEPFGMVLGGALILLPLFNVMWVLAALSFITCIGYLASAAVVTRRYGKALIALLEAENFSFILSSDVNLVVDSNTLNILKNRLQESQNDNSKIFMASVINEVAKQDALPILEDLIRQESSEVRAAVLDILLTRDLRGESMRVLLLDCLRDEDPRVRRAAIIGLENSVGPRSEIYLVNALRMLTDPDLEIRAQILPALIQTENFAYVDLANQTLNRFLKSEDPELRRMGVQILGRVESGSLISMLNPFLADPSDKVRLTAALAVEEHALRAGLTQETRLVILQKLPELVIDPVERVRQAAIRALSSLGGPEQVSVLLNAMEDSSLRVRESLVEALSSLGKTVVPTLTPLLTSSKDQQRRVAVNVLARIEREAYEDRVYQEIEAILYTIFVNLNRVIVLDTLTTYRAFNITRTTILEYNQELLGEIWSLLGALNGREAMQIVRRSMTSENTRNRANAAEALEALLAPQAARQIALLYEPDSTHAALAEMGRELYGISAFEPRQVIHDLIADQENPWFRVMMAFALGEIGAVHIKQVKESQRATRRAGRRGVGNLLNLFDEDAPPARRDSKPRGAVDELLFGKSDDPAQDKIAAVVTGGNAILNLDEIRLMLRFTYHDSSGDVRVAARAARRLLEGKRITLVAQEESEVLSVIEKVIFLKGVPFFEGMTVNQLKVLATVCEEKLFSEDTLIFEQGGAGGALYVVVSGKVGIERHNPNTGQSARLHDIEARSYFGEATLFDNSNTQVAALALQDTLTLRLRHEPLVELMQQYPDLSLQLIKVLSKRIQKADEQLAEMSRTTFAQYA